MGLDVCASRDLSNLGKYFRELFSEENTIYCSGSFVYLYCEIITYVTSIHDEITN